MKKLSSILCVVGLFSFSSIAHANFAKELEKCNDLRPRACGQPGTPSCKSVQESIDACKADVRERAGKETNKKK
jgi:hypothetical protein